MNLHVLSQSVDEKTATVAFHIPVPAGATNEAGMTYRNALVLVGVQPSAVGNITTEEQAELESGQIIEFVETVRFSRTTPGLTPAEKLQELKDAYTARQAELFADKQIELAYTGFATNVP
jgi:hypothetical protein